MTSVILPERIPEKVRDFGKVPAGGASGEDEEFPEEGIDFACRVADVERQLLSSAMKHAGGVQTKAAKLLRMHICARFGICCRSTILDEYAVGDVPAAVEFGRSSGGTCE